MGLFDDKNKLRNRNFGWGLTAYSALSESLADEGEYPLDSEKLSVYVDEDGVINTEGQIMLWKEEDPIDAISIPTFSKENQFIEGLKKVINPFPTYGVLLFPTTLPSSREKISSGGFFGPIYSGGKKTKFPNDTPDGFVPCAGQVLKYPKSSGVGDIVVPNLVSTTKAASDGGADVTTYYAPPGMAYMMKVPDGYEEMVPDLRGKSLEDFGSPSIPTFSSFL